MLHVQSNASPQRSTLAAVVRYSVGRLDAANVAHIKRHTFVATVRLQLNLTVDTQHCVELPIVDAVVG